MKILQYNVFQNNVLDSSTLTLHTPYISKTLCLLSKEIKIKQKHLLYYMNEEWKCGTMFLGVQKVNMLYRLCLLLMCMLVTCLQKEQHLTLTFPLLLLLNDLRWWWQTLANRGQCGCRIDRYETDNKDAVSSGRLKTQRSVSYSTEQKGQSEKIY